MSPEQVARLQVVAAFDQVNAMIVTLIAAVEAADLYLNNYDTSAPSRIKAETRLAVEEAMGLLRARP